MLRNRDRDSLETRFFSIEDTVARWRQRIVGVSPLLRKEFQERLLISLVYHDAALEGEVLTYSEIKAAIDPTIISDSSLIPSYEDVNRYHDACVYIRSSVASKKASFSLGTLREIFAILAPEEAAQAYPYRKENPLHRLYYHDIVAPEQIEEELEGLGVWLEGPATWQMHPIERMAELHFRIMAIFPWAKQSGRCARLASNMLLCQAEYPLAVLHSIDRQPYYEALREGPRALIPLYIEAIETSAMSEIRVYDEAEQAPRRRAS